MNRTVSLCLSALVGAAILTAEEGSSVVVRHATAAVLVDGRELPREGIGIWRLEPGSTVESKTGFVELELGEGVYLRLRTGTVVKLAAESAQAIDFEVASGAVVVDLLREAEKAVHLTIGESTLTPDGKGSFLAQVDPGRFAALKGKAEAKVAGQAVALKTKTTIPVDGAGPAEKLPKLDEDEFEKWREQRNDEFITGQRRDATLAERAMRPAR